MKNFATLIRVSSLLEVCGAESAGYYVDIMLSLEPESESYQIRSRDSIFNFHCRRNLQTPQTCDERQESHVFLLVFR